MTEKENILSLPDGIKSCRLQLPHQRTGRIRNDKILPGCEFFGSGGNAMGSENQTGTFGNLLQIFGKNDPALLQFPGQKIVMDQLMQHPDGASVCLQKFFHDRESPPHAGTHSVGFGNIKSLLDIHKKRPSTG